MKKKVELHTHTLYSHDSLLNKYLYLIMLKLRKINIVAITDHNEIKGAIIFKKFLEKYNIEVIIGEEIFTDKGEIIGLFITERIEAGLTPRSTMEEIKKQGGVVYIPHPYDEKRYKTVLKEEEIKNNIDLIDVIEVHNGRNIKPEYSERQLKIALKYKKIKSVGSDAHTFIELGRNYNIMDEFCNKEEFLISLNTASNIQKPCLKIAHKITKITRVVKMLRRGQFDELSRTINRRIRKRKQEVSKEN
ncbi:PHP domain-containing protein [Peribacillus muralis]|uniref:PHP domain-containing protein n=1 Tax=Peribacillus muralis TaxID=264697 RepID=UPI00366DCC4A